MRHGTGNDNVLCRATGDNSVAEMVDAWLREPTDARQGGTDTAREQTKRKPKHVKMFRGKTKGRMPPTGLGLLQVRLLPKLFEKLLRGSAFS